MFETVARLVLLSGMGWSPDQIPVIMDPPPGKPDGVARLVINNQPRRPIEEQLSLPGADRRKPRTVLRTSSGRVIATLFEKAVPVTAGQLSTLHIGRAKLLVALEPESELTVRYDDCANYLVETKDLADYGDYCERDERPCRAGYTESTEPAVHNDGWCSELKPTPTDDTEVKYCVREGEFRVRANPGTVFEIIREVESKTTRVVVPASGVTKYFPGVYQRCSRQWIATSSDSAVIAVGSPQRLTVDIGPDGRIVGGVVEKEK